MERTLIKDTPEKKGEIVKISGWVSNRRDHGKLIFVDIRDRSGNVQCIILPNSESYDLAKGIRNEYVIELEGLVKERPGGSTNEELETGSVEIEINKMKVLSENFELPVDISEREMNLNLETLLNYRSLTLRNEKVNAIFRIYSEILKAYDEVMRKEEFTEIKTPKILNAATEGGANFFKIKYFDRDAFLAQSPQFYKQAGVGIFERVFEVGTVFRAEPHFTTRHVNEYISLDAEMGFINSFEDVMDQLEKTLKLIFDSVNENCKKELDYYGAAAPKIEKIPRITLEEALKILEKEYGKKMEELDIDPEGERLITEWAQKNHNSDLVFITHYPTSIRPFYTMPSDDPKFTESFDLIFRGVEIVTGGQRIHDPSKLEESMKQHGLNPDDFKHYLDIFKHGMPPHGGWGMGSERLVQKILGLKSIKEAVLYPRDVKRLSP